MAERVGGGFLPLKPGPNRSPRRPPRRALTMEEWAAQQAEKRVAAEVAAIQAQQKIWEEERQRAYQKRLQDAQALASLIQSMGFDTRIQGLYSNAAKDVAGLASGFAGQTRGIAAADAAQQRNMLSGTGQEGAVRDQGTNMGDVLYGVGGWIPGNTLSQQGAAFASDAALQPAFALQFGAEDARKMLSEGDDTALEFAKAIAEARAGKFDYQQDLLEERRSARMDMLDQRLDQLKADRDFWLSQQALYLSQKKYKLAAQAEKRAAQAQQRYNYESAGRDYEGNPKPGYTEGPNGVLIPPGYVYKNGRVVRPTSGSRGGSKGLTPGQKQDALKSIDNSQDSINSSVKVALEQEFKENPTGPYKNEKQRRNKVINKVYQEFAYLATFPAAKKRLRAIIAKAVRGGGGSSGSSVWDS